jgi:hypothetical protein
MPWKTVNPMDETIRFVMLAQSARFSVSELCEQFGISRYAMTLMSSLHRGAWRDAYSLLTIREEIAARHLCHCSGLIHFLARSAYCV